MLRTPTRPIPASAAPTLPAAEGARVRRERPRYAIPAARLRTHAAAVFAITAAVVVGFLVSTPHRVRVEADGRALVVETRSTHDAPLLARAGVRLADGDGVTKAREGGIDVLRVERAHDVRVTADGVTYQVRTPPATVQELLSLLDIVLDERDTVLVDGRFASPTVRVGAPSATGDATVRIDVRRAVPFVIAADGRERLTTSSMPTVAQALREAGITVRPGDAVTPALTAPLEADTRIEVRRARAVTLALPSGHRVVYTLAATVGDMLREAGVVVPQGAFVLPSPTDPVTDGLSVRLVQLSAGNDEEREYVASETAFVADESMLDGETRVVAGHDGVLVRRYSVAYVDGVAQGRELVDERFDPEPVDTIVYYGTKTPPPPPPPAVSASAGAAALAPGSTLRVYATYYTPASAGRPASDPAYGITATGVPVTRGIVAVDPEVIPLGTKLYIPGYGYAVAADTGGAIKGYIIDLGFPDGATIDWTPGWVDITIVG